MLVRLYRNTYPTQIILLVLIALAIWSPALFHSVPAIQDYDKLQPLYNLLIVNNLLTSSRVSSFIALCIMLAQAFLLNKIVNQNDIVSKTTFLPALVYTLLMSYHPAGLTIHPTLIANTFILLIINNLFISNDNPDHYPSILSIGFYLSIASLFWFPVVFIIPLLIISVFIISAKPFREFVILLSGICLPYYFLAFSYFMTNNLRDISHSYVQIFWNFFDFSFQISPFEYAALGLFAIVFLLSMVKVFGLLFEMVIATRRKLLFLILLLAGLTIGIGFSSNPIVDGLMIIFPISAIIVSKYFTLLHKRWTAEFLLSLLLLLIILGKFFIHA